MKSAKPSRSPPAMPQARALSRRITLLSDWSPPSVMLASSDGINQVARGVELHSGPQIGQAHRQDDVPAEGEEPAGGESGHARPPEPHRGPPPAHRVAGEVPGEEGQEFGP